MNRTVQDLVRRLRNLTRYKHRVCDDGDGYTDDFTGADYDGEYVLWTDVQELADEFDPPNKALKGVEKEAYLERVVVCLCGSTRFRTEIAEANRVATMAGKIVLAPGVFSHAGDPITDEDKVRLDRLHFEKIDMADEVLVVNPGGYIGEGALREIEYAERTRKPVNYTHNVAVERAAEGRPLEPLVRPLSTKG